MQDQVFILDEQNSNAERIELENIPVKGVVVEECRAQTACMLNEMWHSRLPNIHWSNVVRNTHYVCYAIFYRQAVIGVAIWSSPVAQNRMKNGKETLELRRLALSDVCPKNTATRVLSMMVRLIRMKFPDIKKLVSYQDTDVHHGTIYKAANWTMGGQVTFVDWSTDNRKRSATQSDANKIRWEYLLN